MFARQLPSFREHCERLQSDFPGDDYQFGTFFATALDDPSFPWHADAAQIARHLWQTTGDRDLVEQFETLWDQYIGGGNDGDGDEEEDNSSENDESSE